MAGPTFGSIGRLLTVTSCKGGVGKSTVSLQLAFHLARRGHRVGLFDADVHGPSLPTQLPQVVGNAHSLRLAADGRSVAPLEFGGVKLMSFGWFSRLWSRQPASEIRVRGPLATNLLQTTEWGELDYLLIDSPPGTGAIPTQIATQLPLAGAVVITTPSGLAVVDVVRGLLHLRRLGVPILALVENMASFHCGGCGVDHHPFGRSYASRVLEAVAAAEGGFDGVSVSAHTSPSLHADPTGIPTFSLPITAAATPPPPSAVRRASDDDDQCAQGDDTHAGTALAAPDAALDAALDALAATVETAPPFDSDVPHVRLPHALAYNEQVRPPPPGRH